MAAVRYTFTLSAVKDADVVRWLELQPNISAAIREALKAYVQRPTHYDLSHKMDEVLTAVRALRYVGASEPVEGGGEEPEKAAEGLDEMIAKFAEGAR